MKRLFRHATSDRGASAVEFGLVLPLLVLVLMGILDWGYYFFTEQVVVNAAREGARAGSLQALDDAAAQADAQAAALTFVANGGLDASKATVAVTLGGQAATVHVEYPAGSLTGFSDLVLPASARATALMRR